jgi:hypothetical protein
MTPSQRSVKYLRDKGYQVTNVESYNAFTKRKHDLYGCIDLLAIGDGETLAVQVTSKSNMKARINKISEADDFPEMLRSKWRVIVHGWHKVNNRYQLTEFEF